MPKPHSQRTLTEARAKDTLAELQQYDSLDDIFAWLERLAANERSRVTKGNIMGVRRRMKELGIG